MHRPKPNQPPLGILNNNNNTLFHPILQEKKIIDWESVFVSWMSTKQMNLWILVIWDNTFKMASIWPLQVEQNLFTKSFCKFKVHVQFLDYCNATLKVSHPQKS